MVTRHCLHCALARALRAEADTLLAHGLAVALGRSEPVWLPVPGMTLYRHLRRLLRDAEALGERGTLRLAVVDLPGKPHVEVLAVVRRAGHGVVLGRTFPRQLAAPLAGGFLEGLAD